MAGSQWHWGLRCLASIFGIRLIILFLVTSLFSRRDFVEMLVIPWWDLYPWWPFVAFCGLLWPFGVFAWWFVVQSATSMDTAVFCGICDNYGIYDGTVGLQCISIFFWVIFTQFRGFQQSLDVLDGIWYFGLGRSGFHGCFDDFSLDLNFGLIIFVFRCIWQPWKVPCQICRWKKLQVRRRRAKSAGKKFQGEKMPLQLCR